MITYDSSRGTKSGEERFKELANNSGVIGGERFYFNPFRQITDGHKNILVPSLRWERAHRVNAPNVKDFTNLDGVLRHLITLWNFSLSLARVTIFDKLVGIIVNGGPEETGIKDLFGSEVSTMMSLRGSIVASYENVKSFFAVYTPSDHLIRTNLEQERVVPKIVFHVFEKLIFLLGCHTLNNEVTRVNPPEQSRLGIFFGKEILKGEMIRMHYAFVHD
nr:hypothetical protein [Tanacetum cinerariifolium]